MDLHPILLVRPVIRLTEKKLELILTGKGLANPTALLLSSLMMLRYILFNAAVVICKYICSFRHMGMYEYADKIEKAALTVRSK